jgi:hypothetical protein
VIDLVKRLRLQPEDIDGPSRMEMLRERIEAADEIERLRAERDAAFRMSRCECDSEEACANLVKHIAEIERLQARVAELEQDAKRYRWLRKQDFCFWKEAGWLTWREDEIDAAMAKDGAL